jgi:hypothetical protein
MKLFPIILTLILFSCSGHHHSKNEKLKGDNLTLQIGNIPKSENKLKQINTDSIFTKRTLGWLPFDPFEDSLRNNSKKSPKIIIFDSIIYHECNYKDLSFTFDYKVKVKRMISSKDYYDSSIVRVFIIKKNTRKLVDSVSVTSLFITYNSFQDCNNVRSYITRKNSKQIIVDGNYGQLVIADLNFDSKEDIALINDSGGSSGPHYSFFIQDQGNTFHLDKFLTDSVDFFPQEINLANKTLITRVAAGAKWLSEREFHLNTSINKWKKVGHNLIDITK